MSSKESRSRVVKNHRVDFVSAEQSANEVLWRILRIHYDQDDAGVSFKLSTEKDDFLRNLTIIRELPKTTTIPQVRNRLSTDVELLVIDYMSDFLPCQSMGAYHWDLLRISEDLTALALELDIPVLTAVQLGRGAYDLKSSPSKRSYGAQVVQGSISQVNKFAVYYEIWTDPNDPTYKELRTNKGRNKMTDGKLAFRLHPRFRIP